VKDIETILFRKFPPGLVTISGLGEIPERSNGADCKSVGAAFGGSNPPLPTRV
jgi:hypothetical protein